MRKAEDLEMKSGPPFQENSYVNRIDLNEQRMKKKEKDKEIPPTRNTQHRVILILGVLLILAFITMVILTSFLFIYYKSISKETSEKNGSLSIDIQSIQGAVEKLEDIQNANESFSSEIQRIWGVLGKVTKELQKMSSPDLTCSTGWTQYGISCYYVSSDAKSWDISNKECKDMKAHLVVINTEGEMTFVSGISNKTDLWIGLTDQDRTWRWVDGTPYDTTPKFWGASQPDDWTGHGLGGGEDCVELREGEDYNDQHCSLKFEYICEKKIFW